MKISYNWLKWYIPEAPDANKLTSVFTYHICEVEGVEKNPDGDTIFHLNILPNRGHDLLSHQGIARELASLLNINFVDPIPKYKIPDSIPTKLEIEITTDKDRRHVGRIIRNIKVGSSPEWVATHLISVGQRSINNIVDATNLVMFDSGQPTHAFNLEKVIGSKLSIRDAKNGEKITLLTGEEKELNDSMIVIADGAGNILDSGIKGGKHAEITKDTTEIILEADNFDPVFARRTGQALNIITDARKRFENDLSPELAQNAMLELSFIISQMCPDAIFEDIVDIYPKKQTVRKLSFSADRISEILGLAVTEVEIKDILKRYNFEYIENNGVYEIDVPYMRLDLTIEEDMAEEIGRILGYDKVKPKIPQINFKPKGDDTYSKISWARNKLLNDGYSEVMTYTFRDSGEVEVENSASDKKFLRTNLADGMRGSIKLNQINASLLRSGEIKIFEIGTVFKKNIEEIHVAFGDKKEIREMSLDDFIEEIQKNSEDGRFQPEAGGMSKNSSVFLFQMWSLFPFIARDVAIWVPEGVKSGEVLKVIKDNAGDMVVRGPELFDEFKKPASPSGGDGKISYAFRLVFQSYDRTLTDAEVNEIMDKINNKIEENNGWQVR